MLLLEPFKQRLRFIAIDLRLAHDWETNAVIQLAERGDVVGSSRFLGTKLITWEAKDSEVVTMRRFEFLVKGFQSFVLGCEAAFRGCVDDKNHLAFVIRQRDRSALL